MYKIKRKIIPTEKNKIKTEKRLFGYDTTFVVEAHDENQAEIVYHYMKKEEEKKLVKFTFPFGDEEYLPIPPFDELQDYEQDGTKQEFRFVHSTSASLKAFPLFLIQRL